MIHMLSAFDLKEGQDVATFTAAYSDFVADLTAAGLIAGAGPVGTRLADTPMDTDDARAHQIFSILSFRDRAQLDAAYAHIEMHRQPGTHSHRDMYSRVTNAVFTCWQDTPPA